MQNSKNNNPQGFSIVLALGITLVLSSISIYLLEYVVPFSRNVKGLDNYTKAYYNSYRGLEDSLFSLANGNLGDDFSQTFGATANSLSYQTISSGSIFPPSGAGESEFDEDRNILAQNKPVHIYLPHGVNWGTTKIYFRVPNFDQSGATTEEIDPSLAMTDIINWQLSSPSEVLNSTSVGSRIQGNNICHSDGTCSSLNFYSRSGIKLDGVTSQNIHTFFSNYCAATDYECTLKLSLVNKLLGKDSLGTGKAIPYLEYKIDFNTSVPYDKTFIQASGKAYGYRKDINIRFPLKMINEAFDFTIFQ